VGGSKVEGSSEKMKEMQDLIKKYETEIKSMHTSEENNKEILTTLRQQTQLLSKETKDLQ
jgi:flagellar basal body rod protein FlgF